MIIQHGFPDEEMVNCNSTTYLSYNDKYYAGLTSKNYTSSKRVAFCPAGGSIQYQGQIGTRIEIQTKNSTATAQMQNTHWSFVFVSQ